jgi:hypothetical protein
VNETYDKDATYQMPDADDQPVGDDHVGFEYPADRLATRPPRKPLEKGMGRPIGMAVVLGVSIGAILFYLKPAPRSAEARPAILPNTAPTAPVAPVKTRVELFNLPAWNDAADAPKR